MRALGLLVALVCGTASAELLWFDGIRDPAEAPPGKLLSDNDGYWGECVLTGVEYTYETAPDNPADIWREDATRFGRRLLDGRPSGSWWVPVGLSGKPLIVVFDFRRTCGFSELDLSTRSRQVGLRIETSDEPAGPWRPAVDQEREQCPDREFHRLPLPEGTAGRYLRLSVEAAGVTWLDEVLVWGDADAVDEAINPVVAPPNFTGISAMSIQGIEKTAFPDARFWDWQRDLGAAAEQPAVWSLAPTWDSITNRPLLPSPAEVRSEARVTMARNETECLAVTLTNTSMEHPFETDVALSGFLTDDRQPAPLITGELRVAGAIPSRQYGVNLGPLLAADNLPGASILRRYLTNAADLASFPHLTLPPGGSVVLWVSVAAAEAEPGTATAQLTCAGGPSFTVRAEVLDVALPAPFVWLQTWSGTTSMFPFVYADRQGREVAYKQSLGVTAWNGWPEPGSDAGLAHARGRTIHQIWGIGDYGHKLYGGGIDPGALTPEDEAKIAEMIRGHVETATRLGLSYDDWYVELTDEPGKGNSAAFGALCRLIRKADPRVRIYCNPSFWVDTGVLSDEEVSGALGPWYEECVDVSVPIFLLLRDHPQSLALFDAPRLVRASYTVSTQSAKSEEAPQVQLYRRQAWDAFARGWNGWGFYSYYAPRGNPWTDLDRDWYTNEDLPDYQMVYPGPRGPIATRQSEAVREGWEDYRLLTLLRDRGLEAELASLLADYAGGAAPEGLRLRALRAAAGR